MNLALELLKAHHVGIRTFRSRVSSYIKKGLVVITDRGVPASVVIPYSEMIELVDRIDEATDSATVSAVKEGRKAIEEGNEGVPFSHLKERIKKTV
jgi:PHD/YefM family antitoxin component YafN of YafNO toxin-antitoxin module